MNATEKAALNRGVELYEEMNSVVDDRTLEIVERRRRTARVKSRGWLVRRMLLGADVLGLAFAFLIAELLFGTGAGRADSLQGTSEYLVFLATIPGWIVCAKLYGLYDRDEERTGHSTVDDLVGVFHMVTVGSWLFVAAALATDFATPELTKIAAFWAFAVVLVTVARGTARSLARRHIAYLQNAVIVGAGDVGQLIGRKLLQHPEYGINIVGFVDSEPKERRADLGHLTLLGPPERLPSIVKLFDVDRVIIAFSGELVVDELALIRTLKEMDVQIDVVPRLFDIVGPSVGVHTIEGLPLLGLPPARLSRSSRTLKRAIDLVGASAVLLIAAPLFAYIALRIKLDSPGPVFFRQTRLGRGMREFTALKFRTMHLDADEEVHRDFIKRTMDAATAPESNGIFKLDRGSTVTNFGRWLRMTSLDELPQLINVLRGDMSLVGPRPCIPYETENFLPHHFERFLVPAGLTGLWQVTARAHSTFGEALDMDVAYARSWSLGLDIGLLLKTPLQMLGSKATA